MQKLRTLSLIVMLLIAAFNSQAQNYKAQNISPTGEITDSSGKVMGKIHNGTVFDAKGNKLGYIDSHGIVTDASGKKLGKATKNGDFYDVKDVIILRTNDAGEVKDYKGHYIGKVDPGQRQHACVLHCFFCGGCK